MPAEPTGGPLLRLWKRVKDHLVQEVPADIACCEFDCRKPQCAMGEWENCSRRLDDAAMNQKIRAPKPPAG